MTSRPDLEGIREPNEHLVEQLLNASHDYETLDPAEGKAREVALRERYDAAKARVLARMEEWERKSKNNGLAAMIAIQRNEELERAAATLSIQEPKK